MPFKGLSSGMLTGLIGLGFASSLIGLGSGHDGVGSEDDAAITGKDKKVNVKEYFTTDEAMKVLGMSKPTILKKMKEKQIVYTGSGGRGGFRISREELKNYAEKNNIVPQWGEWGVENRSAVHVPDKAEIEALIKLGEETIKYLETVKEEAKLELQELELVPEDSVEYKRNVIKKKKIILSIEKKIRVSQIRLQALNAMTGLNNDQFTYWASVVAHCFADESADAGPKAPD